MDEYRKYLAERLFTEDKMVTYRTLSRALKLHVNTAKAYVSPKSWTVHSDSGSMLYEFHGWQNSIAPGKVHATYIILGTRKPESDAQPDGDIEMASSAPEAEPGSWCGDVPTQSLTLVTEERLKGTFGVHEAT